MYKKFNLVEAFLFYICAAKDTYICTPNHIKINKKMSKLNFLKNEFPKLVKNLNPEAKGSWGVLNGQQMVEHMADSIREATGKEKLTILTPADKLDKAKEFAMSDKEFKPGTKNIKMSETPHQMRTTGIEQAIKEYEKELEGFVNYFETNKGATLPNSFFGNLNYEEWLHLFHKHATHHLKQFGLL